MMYYIYNDSLNPYFNLALEEYLLKHTNLDIFMLWRNHNTIVVGKSQNTAAEINADYVSANNISVVRRSTGGGAVYHDMGNLNFTFIISESWEWFSNFEKFTKPVINALKTMGVNAEASGRNDILVDGCKISGNAQTVFKDRIMHHGTLLYSADISKIVGALNVNEAKINSKGIKSIRSRVTNIIDHCDEKFDVLEFKDRLAQSFGLEEYKLTEQDIVVTQKLADEKYSTWEWNYGYSPKYTFSNCLRFDGGTMEVYLQIDQGIISDARLFGDFFGTGNVADVENALKGVRHNNDDIKKALEEFDLNKYFLNITLENFLELVR